MDTSTSGRKQRHLNLCLDTSYSVESGDTELSRIHLPHSSMPETDASAISLETDFIGCSLSMPVLISCMTGGSREGLALNNLLAGIAEERGIAIGTGSIRVMLENPDTISHFQIKPLAPSIPVLANIGAAQLAKYSPHTISEAVKRIQADGLFIHLNPGQEFFQRHGDRNYTGWFENICHLIDEVDFPVLVKETGNGLPPGEGLKLLNAGAAYIDISGMGGTDWIAVETYRKEEKAPIAGESFRNWGYPTGVLLLAYRLIAMNGGMAGDLVSDRIIASGGLRTPREFAGALACGASIAAAALPFIRKAHNGSEEVFSYLTSIEEGLQAAIALTGSGTLKELKSLSLHIPADLEHRAANLAEEALKTGWSSS